MGRICTFFGHRDAEPDTQKLMRLIRELIENQNVTTFWCGGYGAFDLAAAEAVHCLQEEYEHISLILVLAYPLRKPLPALYDSSLYPPFLESVPKKLAIIKRNEWMAQNCDIAVCMVDHSHGGAYYGYRIARRNQKRIYNFGSLGTGAVGNK